MKKYELILPISFFLCLGILICCSCNHRYYAPNDSYLMSLSEKGDIKASVSTGNASITNNNTKRNSISVQAGYSPFKHLGVQGSYFKLSEKDTQAEDFSGSGNGQIGEFAVGGYTTGNKNNPDNFYWVYDLYTGMGWGEVNNFYKPGGQSNLSFRKYFIQAGVHFWIKKNIVTSFGLQLTQLDFNKTTIIANIPDRQLRQLDFIIDNDPFILWSPSLRLQVGVDKFKFFLSLSTARAK